MSVAHCNAASLPKSHAERSNRGAIAATETPLLI